MNVLKYFKVDKVDIAKVIIHPLCLMATKLASIIACG